METMFLNGRQVSSYRRAAREPRVASAATSAALPARGESMRSLRKKTAF